MARRLLWLLPLWLLILVVFSPVFRNEFVVDDWRYIVEEPDIRNLLTRPLPVLRGNYKEVFDARSVGKVSFALDYLTWELNPTGYRLTSLLVHGLVATAVFFWASWWLRRDDLGALAAALFAVHPVHAETLCNVFLRNDIFAALFTLMSLMLFRAAGPPGEGARPGRRRRLLGAAILFWLALASKISSGVLPLLAMVQDGIAGPPGTLRRRLRDYAGFLLLAAAFGLLLNLNLARAYTGEDHEWAGGETPLALRLATTAKSLLDYVRVLLVPVVLRAEWNEQVRTFLDPRAIAGFLLGAGFVVAALRWCRRVPRFALAVLWVGICLLPYTNVVPLAYAYAERYLYLAAAGVAVALAAAASRIRIATFPAPGGEVTGWVLVLLAVFGVRTYLRCQDWRDEKTVWSLVVAQSPENPRGWRNLALEALRAGRLDEAEGDFRRAAELAPLYHGAWSGLGTVRARRGDLAGAEKALRHAVRLAPGNVRHRMSLGRILDLQGRSEEALAEWREAARLQEGFAPPHLRMGAALRRLGRLDEARAELDLAIRLDPGSWEALARRAGLRASEGDRGGAREDLARAQRVFHGDAGDAAQLEELARRAREAMGYVRIESKSVIPRDP